MHSETLFIILFPSSLCDIYRFLLYTQTHNRLQKEQNFCIKIHSFILVNLDSFIRFARLLCSAVVVLSSHSCVFIHGVYYIWCLIRTKIVCCLVFLVRNIYLKRSRLYRLNLLWFSLVCTFHACIRYLNVCIMFFRLLVSDDSGSRCGAQQNSANKTTQTNPTTPYMKIAKTFNINRENHNNKKTSSRIRCTVYL